MENYLSQQLAISISKPSVNMVDELINICESFYNKPAHNLQDLKNRNTKLKGDIFEEFCYRYMKTCYNLDQVWFYKDVPLEIKEKLNLTKNDMGIDFIGTDQDGEYYAIQAKYRKRNKGKKTGVTWKQLSTFYALALKTGPYKKHIVFTNADFVRHIGKKTKLDQTINYNSLSKINHFDWMKIANYSTEHLQVESSNLKEESTNLKEESTNLKEDIKVLTREQIRLKRLIYFKNI
jgi:predicted helicase